MPNASKAATSTPYIPDITLDRSSPVPLYFQISEPIAELINTGALPADTRLEDELSMAARLHVSRPTARQALQRLVDRGLLTRRRGVGTIVSPSQVHRPVELTSLMKDLVEAGHKVQTTIQRYEARPATEAEAEALKIEAGTLIVHIERTRFTNNEPIAVLRNLIPADIAPAMQELSLRPHARARRHPHLSPTGHRGAYRNHQGGQASVRASRCCPADNAAHDIRSLRTHRGVRRPHLPSIALLLRGQSFRTVTRNCCFVLTNW